MGHNGGGLIGLGLTALLLGTSGFPVREAQAQSLLSPELPLQQPIPPFPQAVPEQPSDPTLGTPNQPAAPAKSPKKSTPASKQPVPDQFPPNPLEITEPDPLIPYDYKTRPLTAEERSDLVAAADRLALLGATRLQQGDRLGAFEAWNRELRFRRLLGPLATEVQALGRVGDAAWRENDTTQLRWITKRLDDILAQTQSPATVKNSDSALTELSDPKTKLRLLEELGAAYQLVRLPKIATEIYEQILADARQRNDAFRIEAILITLGRLQMSWFDYPRAAKTFQELLQRAQDRQDPFNTPIYLAQLAYIYEQAKQPAQAIPYQEQLVTFYQSLNTPKPIPALKVKIADNYQVLKKLDQAEANYQLAYQLAQPQFQWADAGDALRKLGEMYRVNKRLPAALRTFRFLVDVEQQAYNTYGVMNAYDQLGQIYLELKDYPEAIAAFQQGLAIAQQLKLREEYFAKQIQQATQESSQ